MITGQPESDLHDRIPGGSVWCVNARGGGVGATINSRIIIYISLTRIILAVLASPLALENPIRLREGLKTVDLVL